MTSWITEHVSNKIIAVLIAGVFAIATFSCFTMTTPEAHSGAMDTVCETVMSLADNTIIQTGVVLLLVLAAAWLSTGARIFLTQSELQLRLLRLFGPPLYRQVSCREYSYLSKLFSAGIIHSKLHSIA